MKKEVLFTLAGVVLLAGAGFFGVKAYQGAFAPKAELTEAYAPETAAPTETVEPTPAPEATEAVPTDTPEPTPTPYISPVDFAGLQEVNPDIYAWLEIEGTDISYPVVQSTANDAYYLDHNSDGISSANGAIFSEHEFNSTDMNDPVTILYGHHMSDGAMFGNLQKYFSDAAFFSEHPTFTVYTPEAELTYAVFAAVPYPGDHILYYHDFTEEDVFSGFFYDIMSTRDLSANLREEYAPEPGDRVLILSTCLIGNNTNRFLVMGKLLPSDQ